MVLNGNSCSKCVGGQKGMIKHGKTKSGNQRYICRNCHRTTVVNYIYKAYLSEVNERIILLTKEGVGIRSTARILKISSTTLLKRIVLIAKNIPKPIITKGKVYEVDEMRTFIIRKDRLIWIAYALERTTKCVVSFSVGKRTNKTLHAVIRTLELSGAKRIYTDGLKNYRFLVPPKLHVVKQFGTNHIERNNLTIRTHLKRLNRKTICFSRSLTILNAVLKIYFWS
jgi:insertion element IS1 protein InsB